MKVLVAGATGCVGGLVIPELLRAGHEVVGLSRTAPTGLPIRCLPVDVAQGHGLSEALAGVDVAYYLVHSFEQSNGEGFASRDRRAAKHFGSAARAAGVRRIVYCGISPPSRPVPDTPHRASRNEVAQILMAAVPGSVHARTWTIVSPDNQFVRFLVFLLRSQRLVFLPPTSRYRFNPIDGRDLGAALSALATAEQFAGKAVDLAGPTCMDTRELCVALCERLDLRRRIVVLPFSPPERGVRALVRRAGLDPTLVLSALASARAGDVLPHGNALGELIGAVRTLDDSLLHAVQSWERARDAPSPVGQATSAQPSSWASPISNPSGPRT